MDDHYLHSSALREELLADQERMSAHILETAAGTQSVLVNGVSIALHSRHAAIDFQGLKCAANSGPLEDTNIPNEARYPGFCLTRPGLPSPR